MAYFKSDKRYLKNSIAITVENAYLEEFILEECDEEFLLCLLKTICQFSDWSEVNEKGNA